MRKYIITLVSVGLLAVQSSFAQKIWTFEECLEYAVSHNTEISKRLNELKRREVTLQSSKDSRLPVLNATIDQNISTGTNTSTGTPIQADLGLTFLSANLSMPLYTGSKISSQIKSNEFSHLAASADLKNAEKNLRMNVAAYYLDVLYSRGQLNIAKQKVELSASMKKRATSLFNNGKCPESEVAEAEAMLSRDEADVVTAEGNVTMNKLKLAHLLNILNIDDFELADISDSYFGNELLMPAADIYTSIENSYPTIISANYNIKKAEQDIKIARSGYYPTLSLVGSFQDFYCGLFDGGNPGFGPQLKNNYQAGIGLRLSIPVFNAFETRNRIRHAKIALIDAETNLTDSKLQLRKDIQQAYYNANIAQKKYAAEQKSESSSSISYRYTEKSYSVGRATLFDLNQSKQQLITSRENALRAKYEYCIRKIILGMYVEN